MHARNLDPQTIVEEIEEFLTQLDENDLRDFGLKSTNLTNYKLPSAHVNAIYGIAEEIKSINFKDELSLINKMQQKIDEAENRMDLDEELMFTTEEEHLEDDIECDIHSNIETKEDNKGSGEQQHEINPPSPIILEEIRKDSEIFSSKKRCRKFAVRRKIPADPTRIDFNAEWRERMLQYLNKFTDLQTKPDDHDFLTVQQINSNSTSLMWKLICPVYGCKSKLTLSCSFNPLPNFRASNFLKHLELHRKWTKEKRALKMHVED